MKASFKYKTGMFALFLVAYLLFYVFPNFNPKFAPALLPMLWVDRATPLLPWSFLIYLSDYVMVMSVVYMLEDQESFNSLVRMAFATLMICGLFFLFFPTTYPRPPYPSVDNSIFAAAMRLTSLADTPNNCFPSMHVAMTGVATWCLRSRDTKLFLFYCAWAFAIFVSTLTTKQHYMIDIGGGFGVILAVVALEHLVYEKWRVPRSVA